MLNIKFSRIIIIGYGLAAGEILQFIHENSVKYQYAVEYIEYEVHPFNQAPKYTECNSIVYHRIQDKIELTSYFEAISDVTLIISASNNYLFTKKLIEKSNITIINFHNALLPSYPGRNAPSWAIYEGQKKTGITWHYVTSGIDEGNIIIQKECEILPDMKAYELVSKLMSLSLEAFKECFQDILTENVSPVIQKTESERKIYKASEIPGNGRFRLEDPPQDIYRLLRSLDYGKNDIFPLPITEYGGNTIRIRRYKIVIDGNKREADNIINIPFEETKYLEIKFDLLYPDGSIGGGIDSLDYFYELIHLLKSVNRRVTANCFLNNNELNAYINAGELYYSFMPGKFLNIWHKERTFIRLYYYIADLEGYRLPECEDKIVCDQFCQKNTNRNMEIYDTLQAAGLKEYAVYHKWIRDKKNNVPACIAENIAILQGIQNGFSEKIEDYFDIYSDNVPLPEKSRQFYWEKTCYRAILKENNDLIGGIVISERGNVMTEEFVFVDKQYRGKNIANLLHQWWYENTDNEDAQFAAWIRDDNQESIRLHINNGYIKNGTYKVTLMKG